MSRISKRKVNARKRLKLDGGKFIPNKIIKSRLSNIFHFGCMCRLTNSYIYVDLLRLIYM